ncbi:hypothetical protein HCA63_06410 [Listeria booriae]|uniref:hypothetical protein n=1 Tax=Listeria booriae TaxID=1552123 RepID=UPI0016239D02|nr:hypothetical protein [Listeria booriae]MBC1887982.1 hypothetical protein [Listeria booriae]
MGLFNNKVAQIEMISGKEQISVKTASTIMKELTPGVVTFGSSQQQFVYQGFSWNQDSSRSVGKAATGAVVGGILTGGIGAIAGGALGGRKKDTSYATISLLRIPDAMPVQLVIKCNSKKASELGRFTIGVV